jgi:hypothetical protein
MKTTNFSHGMIALLDSTIRVALLGSLYQYPLSEALHASAKLKGALPALTYKNRICVACSIGSLKAKEINKQLSLIG